MHRTGPFTYDFSNMWESYFEVENVSTGPGNSGGPILVNTESGFALAGVLVSGSYAVAGAFGLNSESETAEVAVLASLAEGIPATIHQNKPVRLRDGTSTYTRSTYTFKGRPGVAKVLVDLNITTNNRHQIDAFIRSPAGRVKVLASKANQVAEADLQISSQDISEPFLYTKAPGTWSLFTRDSVKGNPSTLASSALTVHSLWLK